MEDRDLIKLPLIKLHDDDYSSLVKVIGFDAPIFYRKAVEKLAWYFKREFNYDFVQYCHDDCDDAQAYLFMNPDWIMNGKTKVVGACCFRYRNDYTNLHPFWALQWIWLHPFYRNKKYLKRCWPYFEKKYGLTFIVEKPLSLTMRFFLKRNKCYTRHTDYKKYLKEGCDIK